LKVKILNLPRKDLSFKQYRGSVTVELSCIEACENVKVELSSTRTSKKTKQNVNVTGKKAITQFRYNRCSFSSKSFGFVSVFPGLLLPDTWGPAQVYSWPLLILLSNSSLAMSLHLLRLISNFTARVSRALRSSLYHKVSTISGQTCFVKIVQRKTTVLYQIALAVPLISLFTANLMSCTGIDLLSVFHDFIKTS